MSYILIRTDGAFVARKGSCGSYTRLLQHARQFPTREQAEQERCSGNESISTVAEAMR